VSEDVTRMKRLFLRMALIDGALMMVAVAFAVAHFSYGVGWALYGFVAFIAAAFAVQLWFMSAIVRAKKGN
jgi:hypothetical protein